MEISFFHGAYNIDGVIRRKKACHILDAEGIALKLLKLFCKFYILLNCVYRTYGVTNSTLYMGTKFICNFNRTLHVPDIVNSIENPENINSVFISFGNEFFYYVI